jgi:conjugative transposon TraN protein
MMRYSNLFWTCLISLVFVTIGVNAQSSLQNVEVTFNKTSSLVFPAVIKSVDRGSRDVLAQKAKGVENVLQLKAARENFPETNLTVITADGAIQQFSITYSKKPDKLIVHAEGESGNAVPSHGLIFKTEMTESEFADYAGQIGEAKRNVRFHRSKKHKIILSLDGVYIKENIMFYRCRIKNQSNINYDVDFLRFYVRDRAKVKRTASQEVDVEPLYIYGDDKAIKGQSSVDIVYAVEKFTIPDAKNLIIEVFEKNGGRNLNLRIKNKTIVKAQLIE